MRRAALLAGPALVAALGLALAYHNVVIPRCHTLVMKTLYHVPFVRILRRRYAPAGRRWLATFHVPNRKFHAEPYAESKYSSPYITLIEYSFYFFVGCSHAVSITVIGFAMAMTVDCAMQSVANLANFGMLPSVERKYSLTRLVHLAFRPIIPVHYPAMLLQLVMKASLAARLSHSLVPVVASASKYLAGKALSTQQDAKVLSS